MTTGKAAVLQRRVWEISEFGGEIRQWLPVNKAKSFPLFNPEGSSDIWILQVELNAESKKLLNNLWISTKQEARSLRPQKKDKWYFK